MPPRYPPVQCFSGAARAGCQRHGIRARSNRVPRAATHCDRRLLAISRALRRIVIRRGIDHGASIFLVGSSRALRASIYRRDIRNSRPPSDRTTLRAARGGLRRPPHPRRHQPALPRPKGLAPTDPEREHWGSKSVADDVISPGPGSEAWSEASPSAQPEYASALESRGRHPSGGLWHI